MVKLTRHKEKETRRGFPVRLLLLWLILTVFAVLLLFSAAAG